MGARNGCACRRARAQNKICPPFLRRKDKWGHSHSVQRQYILYGGLRANGKCVYCGGKPIAHPIYGGYIQWSTLTRYANREKRNSTDRPHALKRNPATRRHLRENQCPLLSYSREGSPPSQLSPSIRLLLNRPGTRPGRPSRHIDLTAFRAYRRMIGYRL